VEGDCGGGSVGVSWKYLWVGYLLVTVDRGTGGYGWTRVSGVCYKGIGNMVKTPGS
jgi:hypothetical protein